MRLRRVILEPGRGLIWAANSKIMGTGMTDEELVGRVREGESAALEELYRRHSRRLHVFFSRAMKAGNPEDLVHDVFVRVIEKSHQFDPGKAAFQTWLFQIARNHWINLYRRGKIAKFTSLEEKIGPVKDGVGELRLRDVLEDPLGRVDESSVSSAIRECLAELEEESERQALVLYHMLGKNYKEIGEVFRKSISAVRKCVIHAALKVRYCLERKGFDSFP